MNKIHREIFYTHFCFKYSTSKEGILRFKKQYGPFLASAKYYIINVHWYNLIKFLNNSVGKKFDLKPKK